MNESHKRIQDLEEQLDKVWTMYHVMLESHAAWQLKAERAQVTIETLEHKVRDLESKLEERNERSQDI